MKSRLFRLFVLLVVASMMISPAATQVSAQSGTPSDQGPVAGQAPEDPDPLFPQVDLSDEDPGESALKRIEPDLRDEALSGSDELVKVTVLAQPGQDLSHFFERFGVVSGANVDRVIGMVPANILLKLASMPSTVAVLNMDERPAPEFNKRYGDTIGDEEPIRRIDASPDLKLIDPANLPDSARPSLAELTGFNPKVIERDLPQPDSYFTEDANGVSSVWAMGTTGDGDSADLLRLAVIDTGVDFANPDLYGTQARVYEGPYYMDTIATGWPIAFDDRSMSDYFLDWQDEYGNWGWYMNTNTEVTVGETVYTGAFQDPDLSSTDPFTFEVFHPDYGETLTYTVGTVLQSFNANGGWYRFGWHPDTKLALQLGEAPGVLLFELPGDVWGDYNAVVIDILADYTFDGSSADAVAYPGSEIACINLGWSAPTNCDLSAGMVYYISNGSTPVPASDWLYGLGNPDPGEVVAFMLNDVTEGGGEHGTLCAGTAVGQGVIDKMPYSGTYGSMNWPPAWYDPATEGISTGPAKDATLIAMGNLYQGGSTLSYYDFTALGYDGRPAGDPLDNEDQPHMSSNSYGSGGVENDGWDLSSRYITLINYGYVYLADVLLPDDGAYSPVFIGSTGNSGHGYGTVTRPSPFSGIMAGASTTFGQFNLGDTAMERDWVNWGDLAGFSDRGPNSQATLGAHVLANGFFGSGNLPLNYLTGGDWAVDYWSGTSRSGPEVMGILALIFDAYYEQYGSYPTWSEARTLLMNGARTTYSDPMAQGAGLANALNSVEIIKGTRGVQVMSSEGDGYWLTGNFEGEEMAGFVRGLFPGDTDTETFELINHDGIAKDVTAEAVQLELYDSREWDFTSQSLAEEDSDQYYDRRLYAPSNQNPFYSSNNAIDTELLQDADLMVVRLSYPFEQFLDDPDSNWWFVYAWAWHDTNSDGKWFTDANGNGIRNTLENASPSEMVRINYSYTGNNAEMRIREPWARLTGQIQYGDPAAEALDDILISLRHFYSGGFDTTDLKVTVELYKEVPWTGIVLSATEFTVSKGANATFSVTATAPDAPGQYTGYIKISYTSPEYAEYVPVQMQVWADTDLYNQLGGVDQGTLYDNGVVFGGSGPEAAGQRAEAGDWRFFYTNVAADVTHLLVQSTWESQGAAPNATDIDTVIYGPTGDLFSAIGDFLYGPYTLEVIGGSTRVGSAPDWEYYTSSGGPEDWSSVAVSTPGIHGVAAQVTRWGGESTTVPFTQTIGTAAVDKELTFYGLLDAGTELPLSFSTNHQGLEGKPLETLTYGLTEPIAESVSVSNGGYGSYLYELTATDAYQLLVTTSHADPDTDADLEVWYTTDMSNWEMVGYSGNTDSNEQVSLLHPAPGTYAVDIYGYYIPDGTTDVDLSILEVSGEGGLTTTDVPTSVVLDQAHEIGVALAQMPHPGFSFGSVFVGPVGSSDAMQVPVHVLQGDAQLTTSTVTANVGDEVVFTLELTNDPTGLSTWDVVGAVPEGMDFVSVTGADFDATTGEVSWTNEECVDSVCSPVDFATKTIVLTLSLNGDELVDVTTVFEVTVSGSPVTVTELSATVNSTASAPLILYLPAVMKQP